MKKFKLAYSQTIALGFLLIILLGTFILCLPFSSRAGEWTPFVSSLFTATSATCVTGLIAYDTYTHWSLFGQLVIITLIQIGGIGFMSIITMFAVAFKRKIGLHDRQLLVQSAGVMQLGGVVKLIKRVVFMALGIEAVGAVILAFRFVPRMGMVEGLYNAAFHAVSAFCNAGFDLMGKYGQFSSMTGYVGDAAVSLTIAALIAVGGLGFFVWDDIWLHRLKVSKYSLHSKLVLTVTAVLIAGGTLLFLIFEYGGVMAELNTGEKVLAAIFQSISPRTAGFNSVDLTLLSEAGALLTIILMFIGGSPGSTAGGIKTTTLAVLVLNTINAARRTRSMVAYKRKLSDGTVKQAGAVITIYLFAALSVALVLCALEPITIKAALFETVSAVATVGLSLGVSPTLSPVSKILVALLMYAGRVGFITLLLALAEKRNDPPMERPEEKVLIG